MSALAMFESTSPASSRQALKVAVSRKRNMLLTGIDVPPAPMLFGPSDAELSATLRQIEAAQLLMPASLLQSWQSPIWSEVQALNHADQLQVEALLGMDRYRQMKAALFGSLGDRYWPFEPKYTAEDFPALSGEGVQSAYEEQLRKITEGWNDAISLASLDIVQGIREKYLSLVDVFGEINNRTETLHDVPPVDPTDLVDVCEEVVAKLATSRDPREAVETIVSAIAGTKDSLQQRILWLLLAPLLVVLIGCIFGGFINPVLDIFVRKQLEPKSSQQEVKKAVHAEARKFDHLPGALDGLRFVNLPAANVIVVRATARANGIKLAQLHGGNVVMVLEQRKAFTLVHWKDKDSEVEVTGWVFSRYLHELN